MEENITEEQEESLSVFDVTMSSSVIYSLNETCRWARLLVYISGGAIVAGMLLVFFNWDEVSRSAYSADNAISLIIWGFFTLFCLVYITFLVLLFIFSIKVKAGLAEKNIQKIEKGITSLKAYFILSALLGIYFIISFLYAIYKILVY
jgi:hypothetical protein